MVATKIFYVVAVSALMAMSAIRPTHAWDWVTCCNEPAFYIYYTCWPSPLHVSYIEVPQHTEQFDHWYVADENHDLPSSRWHMCKLKMCKDGYYTKDNCGHYCAIEGCFCSSCRTGNFNYKELERNFITSYKFSWGCKFNARVEGGVECQRIQIPSEKVLTNAWDFNAVNIK